MTLKWLSLKKKEEKLYKHIDFLVDNGYISEDEGNRRVLKITNGEEFRYPTFCRDTVSDFTKVILIDIILLGSLWTFL